MPKYTPAIEELKAKKVSNSLLENGLNAAQVARLRGTSRQNEAKKARSKPVRDCLAKFLDSPKLKEKLVEVGMEGLNAEKPLGATILLQKDGEIMKAEEQGAIEVKDHAVRHKYWHDLMIASGGIKLDKNQQGVQIFNINYGYRARPVNSSIRD